MIIDSFWKGIIAVFCLLVLINLPTVLYFWYIKTRDKGGEA